MNAKLLFLALLAPLAGCDWSQQQPSPPPHRPPVVRPPDPDRGPAWLDPAPDCRGSMRRGEWLVCDNKNLNWLHRTLAGQWAEERQGADRQRLFIQRQQLQALLSERSACETVDCVATAYRRYLKTPAPFPAPTPRWTPKPKPRPFHHRPRDGRWNWRDNGPSCTSQIGWQSAALLARQCSVVDPEGQCSPERSCGVLRTMIRDGCWDMGDGRPGFCNRR